MKFIGFNILRAIVNKRELSYQDLKQLLPMKYKDHRDYYPIASLYKSGYIRSTLHEKSGEITGDEFKLAKVFYVHSLGEGMHHYDNQTAFNKNSSEEQEFFFATSKADLYFHELKQKRIDRLITIMIAVSVGIITSLFTFYLKTGYK